MKIFIDSIKLAEFSLVQLRPVLLDHIKGHKKMIFITVSPNASKKHPVIRSHNNKSYKLKVSYQNMTHQEQYEYLQLYMKNTYLKYLELDDWIYGIYELNENNNLHMHMLLYSPSIQDEYGLKCLQKTIYAEPCTQYNMNKKKQSDYVRRLSAPVDYMNEIVWFNENVEHIIQYFSKDKIIKNHFPDFTINLLNI